MKERDERMTAHVIFGTIALLITFIAGWLVWIAASTPGGHPPATILIGPIALGWLVLMVIFLLFWRLMLSGCRATAKPKANCWHCGYDLRGTYAAHLDRCPECGQQIDVQ